MYSGFLLAGKTGKNCGNYRFWVEGTWLKIMVSKAKDKIKRKQRNTLKVVKVEYVQVPDAEERLSRVFKILMSSFENIENEAKRR